MALPRHSIRRLRVLGLSLVVLLAAMIPVLAPGASGEASTEAELLPCTSEDEPANFSVYSLGEAFEKLPLTEVIRSCKPPELAGQEHRMNMVSFIYGTCEAVDGGCAPPIEVQSWPACERALADYELFPGKPYPHTSLGELRGVPAYSFDDGYRIELYTGHRPSRSSVMTATRWTARSRPFAPSRPGPLRMNRRCPTPPEAACPIRPPER